MEKQWNQWQTLFWGAPKSLQMVTAATKLRHLFLGRKVVTNLYSILKSRDITLPTKVRVVKAVAFPVIMYDYESWIIKTAECRRIDAVALWCWRRLLKVPWTPRRLNQSILKEINPEYSLEGLMLKLKLQYFGHLMWRTNSLEKNLMLERLKARGQGNDRRWDGWMASLTQCTWVWANSRRYWRTGNLACCSPWGSQFIRHNWVTEQQTNERMNATVFYKKTLWQQGGHSWLTLRWKILCHKKPASPLALFQGEDGSISPEFASLNPETHMEFFFFSRNQWVWSRNMSTRCCRNVYFSPHFSIFLLSLCQYKVLFHSAYLSQCPSGGKFTHRKFVFGSNGRDGQAKAAMSQSCHEPKLN